MRLLVFVALFSLSLCEIAFAAVDHNTTRSNRSTALEGNGMKNANAESVKRTKSSGSPQCKRGERWNSGLKECYTPEPNRIRKR